MRGLAATLRISCRATKGGRRVSADAAGNACIAFGLVLGAQAHVATVAVLLGWLGKVFERQQREPYWLVGRVAHMGEGLLLGREFLVAHRGEVVGVYGEKLVRCFACATVHAHHVGWL